MHYSALSKAVLFASLTFIGIKSADAQCNTFIKKKCMPKISPFNTNGQMNTSTLMAGQSAQMSLTFSAGQDYRILVCAQEVLEDVSFRVLDMSKKVVFDSKEHDYPDFWDFKVRNTQQFIIEVSVPPSKGTNSIVPSGCVSVMVGFKKD
jgi:hypothetical protein